MNYKTLDIQCYFSLYCLLSSQSQGSKLIDKKFNFASNGIGLLAITCVIFIVRLD